MGRGVRSLERPAGILVLVVALWTLYRVAAGVAPPLPVPPPVPAPEPPQQLAPEEVAFDPPALLRRPPAGPSWRRNPFAAPDPWSDAVPDPIDPPPSIAAELVVPDVVTDEAGRLLSPRAPLVRPRATEAAQ